MQSAFIKRAGLTLAIVVAGCSAGASSREPEADEATSARSSSAITYETLVDMIRSRNIASIDQLLAQPELPNTFRRGFTAVFKSQSLQYADGMNPRVIVYGEDAKLVFTFTCQTGDCVELPGGGTGPVAGGNHLELVQWRDATKSFEYRDIAFPEGGSGSPTFSDANPAICMGCHEASDPRPNFEPYNQWPGFYGGNDDGAQPDYLTPGESRDTLNRFLASGTTRPRYRHLGELVEGYNYTYSVGGKTYTDPRTAKNHNIDLNEALYFLNDDRIVDRVRKLPFYDDIKYAVLLGLGGSPFSDPLKALGQSDLAALVDRCTSAQEPASRMVQVLYGLGVDSLPWFMSFQPNLKSELIAPAFAVEGKLENGLFALDPELSAAPDQRSAKAQAGWSRILAARTPAAVTAGFQKCVADHPR
jgi:hypothetical protein